jgi:hypothetical protein
MYLCILDAAGQRLLHRGCPADHHAFLELGLHLASDDQRADENRENGYGFHGRSSNCGLVRQHRYDDAVPTA